MCIVRVYICNNTDSVIILRVRGSRNCQICEQYILPTFLFALFPPKEDDRVNDFPTRTQQYSLALPFFPHFDTCQFVLRTIDRTLRETRKKATRTIKGGGSCEGTAIGIGASFNKCPRSLQQPLQQNERNRTYHTLLTPNRAMVKYEILCRNRKLNSPLTDPRLLRRMIRWKVDINDD